MLIVTDEGTRDVCVCVYVYVMMSEARLIEITVGEICVLSSLGIHHSFFQFSLSFNRMHLTLNVKYIYYRKLYLKLKLNLDFSI